MTQTFIFPRAHYFVFVTDKYLKVAYNGFTVDEAIVVFPTNQWVLTYDEKNWIFNWKA